MSRKQHHTAEKTVNKLRQAEVELGNGSSIAVACKAITVSKSAPTLSS